MGPKAARELGFLLAEQGDAVGMRAAFERAVVGFGHADIAPQVGRLMARGLRYRWPFLLRRRFFRKIRLTLRRKWPRAQRRINRLLRRRWPRCSSIGLEMPPYRPVG